MDLTGGDPRPPAGGRPGGSPPAAAAPRLLLAAAGAVAGLLIAAALDRFALDFHRVVEEASSTRGWIRDLIDPARDFGGFLVPASILVVAVLLDPARWRRLLFIALAWLLSFAVVQVAKNVSGRPRPEVAGGATRFEGPRMMFDDDYASFPSGHSATAFAIAAGLALTYPRGRWAFFAFAAACGAARVAEGRHFPTDVVVGAIIGIAGARLLMRLEGRRSRPPGPAGAPPAAGDARPPCPRRSTGS